MSLDAGVTNAQPITLVFHPAENASVMDTQLHVIQKPESVKIASTIQLETIARNAVLDFMAMLLKVFLQFCSTNRSMPSKGNLNIQQRSTELLWERKMKLADFRMTLIEASNHVVYLTGC